MPPHYLGQLLREDNAVKNKTYVYTYDNAGNITSKKTYSLTSASIEPSGTPTTTTYGYFTGDWGDLLTSFNGSGITYDTIGNPLTYYGSRSFTWEGRRLVGATVSSKSLTFKYNDEGLRTSKTVDGVTTNYYYNGSQLIAEEANGIVILYMYNSTGIVGFRYRNPSYARNVWDTYLYEKNLQGDIVAVYDGNGTKKISYTYDAWGNFTTAYYNGASATNLFNPYTYRGYYYDTDLSLYYLNSRYYDSNTGRFINADGLLSTGQGLLGYNMFAYCNNNPVMYEDEEGDFPWLIVGVLLASAVIGGIIGANSDRKLIPTKEAPYDTSDKNGHPTEADLEDYDDSKNSITEDCEELTTGDRIKNAIVGAGIGLAVSGAAVATGGAFLTIKFGIVQTISLVGLTGPQTAALGILVYNTVAAVAPIIGVYLEPIDYPAS